VVMSSGSTAVPKIVIISSVGTIPHMCEIYSYPGNACLSLFTHVASYIQA
jgi:hypothetical protein